MCPPSASPGSPRKRARARSPSLSSPFRLGLMVTFRPAPGSAFGVKLRLPCANTRCAAGSRSPNSLDGSRESGTGTGTLTGRDLRPDRRVVHEPLAVFAGREEVHSGHIEEHRKVLTSAHIGVRVDLC